MNLICRPCHLLFAASLWCAAGASPLSAAAPTPACPSRAGSLAAMRQFARTLLVEKDPAAAYAAFAAPDFVQRNPPFGASVASTIAQWRTMTDRPASSFDIVSVRLRGDVATIHFIGHLGPGQTAAVDQHDRLRCGKIIAEWAEFRVLENKPPAAG